MNRLLHMHSEDAWAVRLPSTPHKPHVYSYRWREANASRRVTWAGPVLSPRQGWNHTPVPHQTSVSVMAPRGLAGPPCPAPCDGSCCSAAWPTQGRGPGHRAAAPPVAQSSPSTSSAFSLQKAHGSTRASLPFYGRKMNCLPSSGAER